MRRLAAALILGFGGLLSTPGAAGGPELPAALDIQVEITGTPGTNNWYVSNVTVKWIVVGETWHNCTTQTLSVDTPGQRLECSARNDNTGEEAFKSVTIKVDKTAPGTTATPSRTADANGWYNRALTVAFAGSDATSGLESCSPAETTYSGPDNAAATVASTCRDRAGNTAPASVVVPYDETAPTATGAARAPDANGWYNHAVTVAFQGTDATSGVASCTQTTYAGPDDPSVALTGTCADRAGNTSTSAPFTLAYDETAPAATATASRQPDANGWYRSPVTVSFGGSDATSGLATCDAPKTYAGPDVPTATLAGACRDRAGNTASPSVALRYDATAPQVSTTPTRPPNANGWYNAALSVGFAGSDAMSGVASCDAAKSYSGPDSAVAVVSGSCRDNAGNSGVGSFALKYDATAPQATATPGRQPNANGWYNAAVSVAFAGTDATAGIDSCDAAKTYAGPDTAAASLSGSCRDRAGNQSTPSTFPFKYDGTAPQVTTSPARAPNVNGWYNAPVAVGFSGSDATSGIEACDAARTYSGPDNATVTVTGSCRDKAGNAGAGSHALGYDATAPQTMAAPSRPPNANGWHNAPLTVSFSGSDATAGIDSCDAPRSYGGPDTLGTTVAGTCRDNAGNAGTGSLLVRYDATAPVTSATASRQPNANGWYNVPLGVSFAANDATAGVESCDPAKSYSGPDSATATVSGSCRDKAGNVGAGSFALRYDATAPVVTATPARGADHDGWYNRPLPVGFTGGDAASGVESCDPAALYSGPDTSSVSIGGGCRDKAGNLGSGSVAIRYDATGPASSAAPSRPPNANGWYNAPLTVSFSATDSVSGLASCPAATSYGGPDSATAVVSGTCLDHAGNGTPAALAVRYDATAPQASAAPSRPANANGWYNAPLTVSFGGTDATSGVESCTAPQMHSAPDRANASLAGSCTDRAGNASGQTSFTFRYDATPPVVTGGIAVRPPDRNGWYNRPVAFAVTGTDVTSGIDSCTTPAYSGPDSGDASFIGACLDKAGNRGTRPFALRYDGSAPQVSASASRGADVNGWYNQPLAVSFDGSDAVSGLESCSPPEGYAGPDSNAAVVGGICLDRAGNVGVGTLEVRYDGTPPQVTGAIPSRPPDAASWYNRPLSVSFQGSDATSQVEACTEAQYAGPDAGSASVTGSCRDHAGNGSVAASFVLRYDATPPSLAGVSAKAGNGSAAISWTASQDTTLVEVRRAAAVVYRGTGRSFTDTGLRNGVRYRYTVTAYDEAGNASAAEITATPTAPLLSPAAGATVSAPPRLAWKAVENATYYNVQVWRRGKIFSAWPTRTSIRLRRTWTYAGRRYHLTPGRYRWYVWPGFGRRGQNKYGRLLGSSTFVVRGR
jgi:hypothetical protein